MTEQDEGAFLRPQPSGRQEGGGAYARAQAFHDEGVDHAERTAEKKEDKPDLAGADHPIRKAYKTCARQGPPAPVGGDDGVIDLRRPALEARKSLGWRQAVGKPPDSGKQTAMLGAQKARDQGDENGEAAKKRVRQIERPVSTVSGEEQRNPGEDEDELGRHADGRVGHHGRRGVHPGDSLVGEESHTGEVAADPGNRQERVDQLADPADPEDRRQAGPAGSSNQRAPGDRAEHERDHVEEGYRREAPSKNEHDPADVLGAAVDEEEDEQREPQKAGDFNRCANDRSPGRRPARAVRRANKSASRPGLTRILATPNWGRSDPHA